jgi:hypothetical protein
MAGKELPAEKRQSPSREVQDSTLARETRNWPPSWTVRVVEQPVPSGAIWETLRNFPWGEPTIGAHGHGSGN